LGLLAVGALGMMFMLVRKAGKPAELPSAQELVGLPPALEAGADIVGEADEGSTAMEGIELPDDQVRVNKMLETIGEMVKNKPQDAAAVLNRWIQVET
jgi:flagellar biosynthesis/type III secretory pathway M-ring protein FliF/YscJ